MPQTLCSYTISYFAHDEPQLMTAFQSVSFCLLSFEKKYFTHRPLNYTNHKNCDKDFALQSVD